MANKVAVLIALVQLYFLSSKKPIANLVLIPASAATVIPLPISCAEKPRLLKISGFRYKTPPAPTAAHKRVFMINLRFIGKLSQ